MFINIRKCGRSVIHTEMTLQMVITYFVMGHTGGQIIQSYRIWKCRLQCWGGVSWARKMTILKH